MYRTVRALRGLGKIYTVRDLDLHSGGLRGQGEFSDPKI